MWGDNVTRLNWFRSTNSLVDRNYFGLKAPRGATSSIADRPASLTKPWTGVRNGLHQFARFAPEIHLRRSTREWWIACRRPRWPDLPAVSARPAMAYVPIVLSKSHRVVLSRLGPDPEEFGVLHRTGRQRGNGGLAVFSFGGTSSCNQQRFSAKESGQAAASRSNLRWLQVHDLNLRFDKF
jgi:hypothetical protein